MRLGIGVLFGGVLLLAGSTQAVCEQASPASASGASNTVTAPSSEISYTIIGATPEQEAILRSQLQIMHPETAPLRVVFLPHDKYLYTAKVFQLHLPAGYGSLMFTHLASRTVLIDNSRYLGEEWLGYWVAHELGHLKANSVGEVDAERAAKGFRERLKEGRKAVAQAAPLVAQ
jgi:hypothetical protein